MHSLHDARVVMAQQQRAVPAVVVHVLVAVDIPLVRSLGAIDIYRVGVQVARIVHDAARQHLPGAPSERLGLGGPLAISGDDFRVRVARVRHGQAPLDLE